jgi:predicted Zn-dependent peptidase
MTDPVHKGALDNGLRVVTIELPHLHSAMIAVYVRAGSRHEDQQRNGVSHFLEHLFFRGSRGYPDGRAMNALVEDAGGSLNGVTTRDHGYYYSPIHPQRLETAIAVLGDMLARPLFKDVELEREVILEEILDEVDEEGRDIDVDNLSKRALFGLHPLGYKIAGTKETVAALTEADLRAHHQRCYGARNMVLAVAGPLRHGQVMELAAQHFGVLPSGEPLGDTPLDRFPGGPQLVSVDHRESQTEVRLTFPGPPEQHADFAPLIVLRRVLDDGLASRLQLNVVERQGLAYAVHAGVDVFSDCSLFEIEAACAPKKAPLVGAEFLRLLAELCDVPVPEEELHRARLRHRIGLEFSMDSQGEMLGWFGGTELFRPAETFAQRIARVDAVTADDVRRVARGIFRRGALLACAVGPMGGVDKKLTAVVEGAAGLPA